MNTAQLLVKCLENEGVKYIFGIPGEEVLDIMQALRDSSIKFILVRHEQGAAFMADVYGRLTGKAGVCLSTLGPGATNLITGLADANCDGVPLVAITGQVPTDRLHITAHQFLDLNRLFSPITKRTKEILSPETVQEVVRLAFKYAEGDMPGATHITLPVDVARMPVAEGDVPLKHSFLELDERAEWGAIDQAAELIRQGKKTVVLAGNGVVRNHAGAALTRLADNAHLPVINTMMAKGVIRCDDSYSCSTVGLPFRDFGNLILSEADTIVAVGYDLVELDPSSWNKDCRTHIVHVATLPADVNKYYQADVQVVGSLSQSLDGIASLLSDYVSDSSWALEIRKMAQENDEEDKKDASFPAKPQRIIADIRSVMSDDDILVSDVGANKVWVAREFPCYLPNTCLISNGFASMGFCLPGAIAAKLVYPERHVVGVTGDGGFLMNCQELETAVRLGLSIVIVILHDDSYGLIKWKEMDHYGSSCFVDYGDPDFVAFAESFGAKGYRIARTEELVPVLKEAFSQSVPSVIDCPVDYRENLRLEARMKEICASRKKG